MHLLYLDESGNPDDAADRHFVLAGVSAFEKNTHFLASEADRLQTKHFPGSPPIDFHSQHIRSGKGFWRAQSRDIREQVLVELAEILAKSYASVRLFGAVVEKTASLHGEDAVKTATEQVCKRFDTLLKRRLRENDEQRGLLVFAESHYQTRAKVWVKGFKELGTQWGLLHSLCDIPYFAPAKESRLLQFADYVSHALFLLYENHDPALAKAIIGKFDPHAEGVLHGLVHISDRRGPGCDCPACYSRRIPWQHGPWVT